VGPGRVRDSAQTTAVVTGDPRTALKGRVDQQDPGSVNGPFRAGGENLLKCIEAIDGIELKCICNRSFEFLEKRDMCSAPKMRDRIVAALKPLGAEFNVRFGDPAAKFRACCKRAEGSEKMAFSDPRYPASANAAPWPG
jgi:hypothetical protein